jgi:uncharacterized protein Yka (UPF0111/DUF47 family)
MRRKRRWFLPDSPDLLGQLHSQAEIVRDGLESFAAWAAGDEAAGDTLAATRERADEAKRALLDELREAFLTPIEPEDLFTLSRGLDWILVYSRDLVSEARALGSPPDARLAEMAGLLRDAVEHICMAIAELGKDANQAPAEADEAIQQVRRGEHAYYTGMGELLRIDTRNERIANRELYRRCARIGEEVVDVAERIVYSVVKES